MKGLGKGLLAQTQLKGKQGFRAMDFNIKIQLRIGNP
jgi:hypothetical protein